MSSYSVGGIARERERMVAARASSFQDFFGKPASAVDYGCPQRPFEQLEKISEKRRAREGNARAEVLNNSLYPRGDSP